MSAVSTAPIRLAIVDDEPLARERLTSLVTAHLAGVAEVAGDYPDGPSALAAIDAAREAGTPIDVLLLDVRMPGLSGFDVVERLPPEGAPAVVFTTAYDEHALKAFEANAVDYLLKPIKRDRLVEAIERVRARQQAATPEDDSASYSDERLGRLLDWFDAQTPLPAPAAAPPLAQRAAPRLVSIPFRDRILVLPAERIVTAEIIESVARLFVEEPSEGGRTKLRQHIVSHTLDHIEGQLGGAPFLRVHRSALVNLNHLVEIVPWFSGRTKLILTGRHEVIASRERSKTLRDQLLF